MLMRKYNRKQKRAPKQGLFWCWKCDAQIVGLGQKCKVCGARYNKKFKKEPIEEWDGNYH